MARSRFEQSRFGDLQLPKDTIRGRKAIYADYVDLRDMIARDEKRSPYADPAAVQQHTDLINVRDMIAAEDERNPYTDEEIVARLARRGYTISVERVRQCREQAGIPNADERRRQSE
jgi:DNA-directed RNA polymerase specialized sigma54-like protein